jgi:CheY-like chemotaxis protein
MSHGLVLVVDDDDGIREVVSTILEGEGYPVRTASNGDAALQVLEESPVELVLLDLRMPGPSSSTLVHRLRARPAPPRIAIMSGASEVERIADDLDADGCLSKPFELETLLSEVTRICPDA